MTALWILAGILLLLCLLSRLRFRVALGYREDGGTASLRLGPFRYQVYPQKRKKHVKKSQGAEKEQAGKKGSFLTQLTQNRELFENLLRELLPMGKEWLGRFQEKLRVDFFRLQLVCAQDDPADAALFYGHANAVMGALLPLLERWFTIKKKEIDISLDFEREKPQLWVQVQFSLTAGQMIAMGAFALAKGWQFYQAHRARRSAAPQTAAMKKTV